MPDENLSLNAEAPVRVRRRRPRWRRAIWLLVPVLLGAWGVSLLARRPDAATRVRRMRDAASDTLSKGDAASAAAMLEACVAATPNRSEERRVGREGRAREALSASRE